MPTTTRLALPYPALTDTADVPRDISALATALDVAATYAEGTLVGRPAAGLRGRIYRATDTGQVFLDNGAAWVTLSQYAEGTAAGRPAASTAGRVYRATDTNAISLDTGAAWVAF